MKVFNMISVPGTGTRFLRNILDANGCPPVQQMHTYVPAEWHQWFDSWVICPIRDPMLHAIGRMTREHGPPLFDEFELLATLVNEGTHIFRVDTPDRIEENRRLSDWLERDVAIDWSPDRWFQAEDKTGWRERYLTTGKLPDETWPAQVGDNTKALLKKLDYTMDWLRYTHGA